MAEPGYTQLVEHSPVAVLVCADGRIEFLNTAAARILETLTPDALIGARFGDLFGPIGAGGAHGVFAEEVRFVTSTGSVRDLELTSVPMDEAGHHRVQVIVRDVTDRKRAEISLRESEERLRLAVAGAQEGVWDWNIDTDAVVYSPRWKEMLGYLDDEIEPHVSAWERLLHPDDRARAHRVNTGVIQGGQPYEMEVRLQHKDGHYLHVLSRGYAVRHAPDGRVVRIVGTHLDLTERKRVEAALRESEERLTMAFAGAQEGVWDWNLETNAVVYSPRWKQMLGYSDDEIEPHVSAWERLVHPEDRPRADTANESVAHGEPTYEAEFRLRHKNGHYVHVLSRGFPVRRSPGGPVVRIVGTHFDLTERKRAETERARTEFLTRLVFAQEDERRRIAREMHDQFGEQLTTLGRQIGLLMSACENQPELRAHVEKLEAVAAQIDRDVDHLVWELRPTALDDLGLRAALSNYVADWSRRAGVPAELHTTGLIDDRLSPDIETTLYRIAQEALTNVAKHAHASRVAVMLERRADCVLLIVEDDGVGFEAGEGRANGQGFGLLGMQERAALVDATLEIESAAGQGTTILVRMGAPATQGAQHA